MTARTRIVNSLFLGFLALSVSCSTDDDSTVIGSDFVTDARQWAEPVDATFHAIASDTWFEAIVRGGQQQELLIGRNRKFSFNAAVRWDNFPADPDSIVSASLLIKPTSVEGSSMMLIERIAEDWSEGVSVDSYAVLSDLSDRLTIPMPVDEIVPIDIDWVRPWADPEGTNRGLLFSLVDDEGSFIRIPAREDPDSTASLVRLRLVYRDSAGVDSVDLDPAADRFDDTAFEDPFYAVDNLSSDTMLVGMRESLTQQPMLQLLIPEPLMGATVNHAEMWFTVAGARLEEDESLSLELHEIWDDEPDTSECYGTILCDSPGANPVASGTEFYSGEDSDLTVRIDITSQLRRWVSDGEREPRLLMISVENNVGRRYLSIHSVEAADSLSRPRLKVLYTPPRPDSDKGGA